MSDTYQQPTFGVIAVIPTADEVARRGQGLAAEVEAERQAKLQAELEEHYPLPEGPRVVKKKLYRQRSTKVVELTITKVITDANSFETAYIQTDYPYGSRLRCKRASWVEYSPRYGLREVHRTTNPKRPGERWNSPHAETYTDGIVVLFVATGENEDGKEYVYSYDLRGHGWAELAEVQEFERLFPELLWENKYARQRFEAIKAAAIARAEKKASGEKTRLVIGRAEIVPGQGWIDHGEEIVEV